MTFFLLGVIFCLVCVFVLREEQVVLGLALGVVYFIVYNLYTSGMVFKNNIDGIYKVLGYAEVSGAVILSVLSVGLLIPFLGSLGVFDLVDKIKASFSVKKV